MIDAILKEIFSFHNYKTTIKTLKYFTHYIFITMIYSIYFPNVFAQDLNPDEIYEKVKNDVVMILTYDRNDKPINQGSGVIIDSQGHVYTNLHLMEESIKLRIIYHENIINEVSIVGSNVELDILLLQLPYGVYEFIDVFESNDLKIGQKIYAIGNPLGFSNTFSEGIISGFRTFENNVNMIQITASISPGSSGGAVINSKGELIGISSFTFDEGQNLNFVIPIQDVLECKITPYSVGLTKTDIESRELEEEKELELPHINYDKNYNPKALEFLNKGKDLIRESYAKRAKKDELKLLKEASQKIQQAIKIDPSIIESYYLLGQLYANPFGLNDFKKAKGYYKEVEEATDKFQKDFCDSISNREILVNIAEDYQLREDDIESNLLTSISFFEKALRQPLPMQIHPYAQLEDDNIYVSISSTYHQLANYLTLNSAHFMTVTQYYNSAIESYLQTSWSEELYDLPLKELLKDKRVGIAITSERDWKAFRNLEYKSLIYREGKPLASNNIIYLYKPNSVVRKNKNIIRMWIKEIYLEESYEQQSGNNYTIALMEFDIKNKKSRVLQNTVYSNNLVMDNSNNEEAKWEYINPDSIGELILEFIENEII